MTFCVIRSRPELQRITWLALLFAWLLSVSGQAAAAQVAVVMSDDSAPYQEVYQVIRTYLEEANHEASRIAVENVNTAALNEARLTVAVGVRAAEAIAALPNRSPVLAVLVPRAWYVKTGRIRLSDGGRRTVSAIFLDQPFERQAKLIRQVYPDARRVGVLLSTEQSGLLEEINEAMRSQRLSLVSALLAEDEQLIRPLEAVLSEADLLLAVPDPGVLNRNTAQSLLLTSYRYRDPVIGYSRSLTRAGALVSLFSTPAQIGRQAAEWVSGALSGASVRLPLPAHPSYFEISINEQVARSLGFSLPSEDELEKRLGGLH